MSIILGHSLASVGARRFGTAFYSTDTEVLAPGGNRPGRQVDYSSPSGAESKKEWSYTSIPQTCLHVVEGDKLWV